MSSMLIAGLRTGSCFLAVSTGEMHIQTADASGQNAVNTVHQPACSPQEGSLVRVSSTDCFFQRRSCSALISASARPPRWKHHINTIVSQRLQDGVECQSLPPALA